MNSLLKREYVNNEIKINEITLTSDGFIVNGKRLQNLDQKQNYILKDTSYVMTDKTFHIIDTIPLLKNNKRLIIEIKNVNDANEIISNIRKQIKVFAGLGFTNFMNVKIDKTIEPNKCEDISFIDNNEVINGYKDVYKRQFHC